MNDKDPSIHFSANPTIWFYKQPGGCLEIGQYGSDGIDDTQDLVHICSQDVPAFFKELKEYDESHG